MKIWQRYHEDGLIASVIEQDVRRYAVAVWCVKSNVQNRLHRTFSRLQGAKASADELLRKTFEHNCSIEQCGEWLLWHE